MSQRAAFRSFVSVVALLAALLTAGGVSARTEEAESFNQSADQLIKKGDLRAAAIQLRNAIQKDPEDGLLRLKLAQLDLRLGEPLAAEAAALAAKERGVPEPQVAPVLGNALYQEGEFSRLLKSVPAGDRAAKVESIVRMLRGLSHLALGERAEAEPMLRDAVRLDPESDAAKVALVGWLIAAGKLDEADQLADAALAAAPNDGSAAVAKARILASRGDTAGALARLAAVVERDPNDLRARFARVGLLIRQRDLDTAQKDLDVILKRTPKSGGANYFQALIYLTKGDLNAADATLTKMGGSLGDPPESYYLAGVVKFRLNQPGQAEDFLTRFVARNPNSSGAYTYLGRIALGKGNAKQAVEQFNRALKLLPDNVEALTYLGQAYAALGDTQRSLEVLEAAAKAQPENSTLQAQVALSRMNQGQTTEGIEQLEHVFRDDTKKDAVGATLVLTALRVGEFEKAVAAAEELVKREPDNAVDQQLLGIARAGNQDLPGAEAAFRGLLDKHPELLPARRNLAEIYVAMGRGDDARQLFDEPLKKTPNDVRLLSALADINARLGKVPEAIALLTRAQGTATDSAPGLRLVALQQSQKDTKAALAVAVDLERRFPQDVNVIDALARMQAANGDLPAAIATYRQKLSTNPDSLLLLDHLARALVVNKEFAAAREPVRHELALVPNNEAVQRLLVQIEYWASGPDAAVALARSLGGANSLSPAGDIMAAQVLAENGKLDQGVALLEKASVNKPSPAIVAALAGLYARGGHAEQAVDALKKWLAAHPNDVVVRIALAQTYLTAHADKAAQAEFETLAAARESDPMVLNNLAWLYQRSGDPRAPDVAKRAYRLAPTPEIADTLGWILTAQGGADTGLKYLEAAGKALPDNLDVQYHLAVALQKTGKVEDARGILRKIVAQQGAFESRADATQLLSQLGG